MVFPHLCVSTGEWLGMRALACYTFHKAAGRPVWGCPHLFYIDYSLVKSSGQDAHSICLPAVR